MASEKSVKVIVEFVNKASAGLTNLSKEVKKVETSTNSLTVAAQKNTSAWQDTAKGVFAGALSYDILKTAVRGAGDFLASSIKESLDAAATMALVKVNIENAGLAYDKIGPKLDEYSKRMIQMGFDDEDTAQSVSKLAIVTGDYDKALKLNQLAMDLSRNKHIGLEEATKAVALVTQGNVRVLKEYGISIDENTSVAEALTIAQDKLKGSSEAFAKTTAGSIATLAEEYANLKQGIGDELVPAFNDLLKILSENKESIESIVKGLTTIAGFAVKGVGAVVGAADKLGFVYGNILNKLEGLPVVQYESAASAKKNAEETTKLAESQKVLGAVLDKGKGSFDGIGASSKKSTEGIEKQKLAIKDLGDIFSGVNDKQKNFVFKSKEDFDKFSGVLLDTKTKQESWAKDVSKGFDGIGSSIDKLNNDIESLQKSLTDAKKAFADFEKSSTSEAGASFAKIVSDAEKAIPKLQEQIAKDQGQGTDTTALEAELAEKQAVILSAQQAQYQSNQAFVSELAFLREQDARNELDQAYASLQRKIEIKRAETDADIARINETIAQRELEKQSFIAVQAQMTAALKTNVEARKSQLQSERANLDALRVSVDQLRNSYINLFSVQANKTTKPQARAEGGPVSAGTSYLVGEKGPEMFTPNSSGTIIPNNKLGGGVTVNINNPSVRSDSDINQIVRQVSDAFARRDELAEFGAYR